MYRATGPGKIDVIFEATGANILEARLYNFDFDDYDDGHVRQLKTEHAKFLYEHVIPRLANLKGNIWLQGSASRIGSKDWNMTLSMVRGGAVEAFLLDRDIKPEQIEPDAVGNTLTATHALDDAHDRSVLLWVYPRFEFHPPLEKKVPSRPKISSVFKIAVDGNYPAAWAAHHRNLSIGGKILKKIMKKLPLSSQDIPFLVWDTTNNIACKYIFNDLNFGFDISIGTRLPKPHGPWSTFFTSKPIGCWQFGRDARLTKMGDYKTFYTMLHVETPPGVNNVAVKIDTGITVRGISGSFTLAGDFARMEGPAIFSGL
jgi:hypothetical protein